MKLTGGKQLRYFDEQTQFAERQAKHFAEGIKLTIRK